MDMHIRISGMCTLPSRYQCITLLYYFKVIICYLVVVDHCDLSIVKNPNFVHTRLLFWLGIFRICILL